MKELNRIKRAQSASTVVNEAMLHTQNEVDLLENVCKQIVDVGEYIMVWVGYVQDTPERKVKPMAYGGGNHGYTNKLNIALNDPKRGRGPTGNAICMNKPVICRNFKKDPTFKIWANQALKRGYKTSIHLPLQHKGTVFGVLCIYSDDIDAFNTEEERILMDIANNLAFNIAAQRAG